MRTIHYGRYILGRCKLPLLPFHRTVANESVACCGRQTAISRAPRRGAEHGWLPSGKDCLPTLQQNKCADICLLSRRHLMFPDSCSQYADCEGVAATRVTNARRGKPALTLGYPHTPLVPVQNYITEFHGLGFHKGCALKHAAIPSERWSQRDRAWAFLERLCSARQLHQRAFGQLCATLIRCILVVHEPSIAAQSLQGSGGQCLSCSEPRCRSHRAPFRGRRFG